VRAPAKLAAFAAGLAIVVGGGAGIGAVVGPIDTVGDDAHEMDGTTAATGAAPAAEAGMPGGLAIAQDGYRLDVEAPTLVAGEPGELRFRVLDAAGSAVTRFDVENEKRLHLVVVGRNLVDYAHLHPTLHDGAWRVELPALPAGSYRAFADFRPTGGDPLTLGVDLTIPGLTAVADHPAPSRHVRAGEFEVTLDGETRTGESELAFTVSHRGQAVRTDPYLGAAGHLVAIRAGDLAYLHVHPIAGGDRVRFAAEFPSPGTYRLFLDFADSGTVTTAAFTVEVTGGAAASGPEHEGH
jgi:hypothetical protein